ncbi:hypothetical protein C8R45DRAFT_942139 [Mycena sanguinolenta]|nr:hypothetical protein C8R45DRAFT_942139 [Mycena sanguinolenta]
MRSNILSILACAVVLLGSIHSSESATCEQANQPCNGGFGACCANLFCVSIGPVGGSGALGATMGSMVPAVPDFAAPPVNLVVPVPAPHKRVVNIKCPAFFVRMSTQFRWGIAWWFSKGTKP